MQIPQTPSLISTIPAVASDYYENIFNVYNTEDAGQFYYFNISNKVVIDVTNIDEQYIDYIYSDTPMPLTTLSFRLFGSMHLWWLVAVMNKLNPLEIPPANTVLAVPKAQYLAQVFQAIKAK